MSNLSTVCAIHFPLFSLQLCGLYAVGQPPDIKHHRIPAPELAFDAPNLPFLIREVEGLMGRAEE